MNRLYNRLVYPLDQREPAYRHHILVSKGRLEATTAARLEALRKDSEPALDPLAGILGHPELAEANGRLLDRLENLTRGRLDTQFLFRERERLIALLRRDLQDARAEVEATRYETPLHRLLLGRLRRRFKAFRGGSRRPGSE